MQEEVKPETTQRSAELCKQTVTEQASQKSAELTPEPVANGNRSDVLIVSSRPEHLKILMRVLSAFSGRVVVASSLRLAKEALAVQSFGIIFCEESLSDGSYRDLLIGNIRPNGPKLVLLLRSGEWPEYLEAIKLGAFDALCSPLQPADVQVAFFRAESHRQRPRS